MRAHRKTTAAICRLLIGLLLFSQAAFATQPCVEAGMSAAAALAATEGHECCETSVSERTLCVMKCTDADKVSAHPPLLLPPVAGSVVLTLAPLDERSSPRFHARFETTARDPPKTIRFCSFLI